MRRQIKKLIETEINPAVAGHGGVIELLDVMNNKVYLRMGGGCQGCGMASQTLRHGVERMIRDQFPDIEEVVDATDHSSGSNPYYQPSK